MSFLHCQFENFEKSVLNRDREVGGSGNVRQQGSGCWKVHQRQRTRLVVWLVFSKGLRSCGRMHICSSVGLENFQVMPLGIQGELYKLSALSWESVRLRDQLGRGRVKDRLAKSIFKMGLKC
jgi:hypothetical protein